MAGFIIRPDGLRSKPCGKCREIIPNVAFQWLKKENRRADNCMNCDGTRQYTYIILAAECARVKIGKSNDPKERLADLQVGSPAILELVEFTAEMPEGLFHDNEWLQDYRFNGEWYNLTVGFIEAFEYIVENNCYDCNFGQIDLRDELEKCEQHKHFNRSQV